MALHILELFGYAADDQSRAAKRARIDRYCPFLETTCIKPLRNGEPSGVCTVRQIENERPVICCPNRLYAGDFKILGDVAQIAFRGRTRIAHPDKSSRRSGTARVVAFGKRWGKELRIPRKKGSGGYYVDWILARLNSRGAMLDFVAIEVQSIDTTGNYKAQRLTFLRGATPRNASKAGINWENVSKRILPQLIYKGHVLRLEARCQRGLFFVCPQPVYEKIVERLGGGQAEYQPHKGSITFVQYDLGGEVQPGRKRRLKLVGSFTTTVDAVAAAFAAPTNLPPSGVYERAIVAALPDV